jgi:hypothetical protein
MQVTWTEVHKIRLMRWNKHPLGLSFTFGNWSKLHSTSSNSISKTQFLARQLGPFVDFAVQGMRSFERRRNTGNGTSTYSEQVNTNKCKIPFNLECTNFSCWSKFYCQKTNKFNKSDFSSMEEADRPRRFSIPQQQTPVTTPTAVTAAVAAE